eukprot:207235-Rhodomonas_salina.2
MVEQATADTQTTSVADRRADGWTAGQTQTHTDTNIVDNRDRYRNIETSRKRASERARDRQRETARDSERQRETARERKTEKQRESESARDSERDSERPRAQHAQAPGQPPPPSPASPPQQSSLARPALCRRGSRVDSARRDRRSAAPTGTARSSPWSPPGPACSPPPARPHSTKRPQSQQQDHKRRGKVVTMQKRMKAGREEVNGAELMWRATALLTKQASERESEDDETCMTVAAGASSCTQPRTTLSAPLFRCHAPTNQPTLPTNASTHQRYPG